MDNFLIYRFLSMDNEDMDKMDLGKINIVIYFHLQPWKKYYFNRPYCPMDRMERIRWR